MNRVPHYAECKFMRMYDYTYRIYDCDHEDRIDDMGRLNVDHLLQTEPKWMTIEM